MKYTLFCLLLLTSAASTCQASDEAQPVRVLLVDDEPINHKVVARKFSSSGSNPPYVVECASSRKEGLELLESGKHYDVIVSDLNTGPSDIAPGHFARQARKNSNGLLEALVLYTSDAPNLPYDATVELFDAVLPKNPKELLDYTQAAHEETKRRLTTLEETEDNHPN